MAINSSVVAAAGFLIGALVLLNLMVLPLRETDARLHRKCVRARAAPAHRARSHAHMRTHTGPARAATRLTAEARRMDDIRRKMQEHAKETDALREKLKDARCDPGVIAMARQPTASLLRAPPAD